MGTSGYLWSEGCSSGFEGEPSKLKNTDVDLHRLQSALKSLRSDILPLPVAKGE